MKLAAQLGSFAGQLTETGLRSATITFAGEVAGLNTRPLTAATLQGLLAPLLDSVNMVNAPSVARERNIAVTTVHQEAIENYQTLIRLTVSTERGERSVAGTLFQGKAPRLVEIRDIEIDAQLGPHMLYVRNDDRPGLIGGLGSALGDAGVNIATFHLGRTKPGGDAIALIEVDQPVPPEVLQRICELPHVTQCKQLRF
jgi:D-3-phosphoglycerate dehydrogenase